MFKAGRPVPQDGHFIMVKQTIPRHATDDLHCPLTELRRCGNERIHEVTKSSEVSRRPWTDLSSRPGSVVVWLVVTSDAGSRALCCHAIGCGPTVAPIPSAGLMRT